MDKYEIAIVGSGPAGYVGAIKAAREGISTCVIEKSDFGGVCLNTGCIPTKTLVASAKAIRSARRAAEYGFKVDGDILVDMAALTARKNRVVDIERASLEKLVRNSGVDIIRGHASFSDTHSLRVDSNSGARMIFAKNIVVATGSVPASLPFLPYDGKKVFSGDNILTIERIPDSMLIIGGGYIGCEYASLFSTLGAKVTIIEALPRLLNNTDEEIVEILAREFKKESIDILTGRRINSAHVGDTVSVTLEDGTVVSADIALVAVGRRANTQGLVIENIGLASRQDGSLEVNNQMMTNTPGVFAVGDVIGNPMLAHVASAECRVAIDNALGNRLMMDYSVIPSAIYTHPEIGSIGITEAQARDMGMEVSVGRVLLRSLGIAHASGEIAGMAKIICDSISDEIVGVHMIGERAADLIHEVGVAMFQDLSVAMFSQMIHAHPTFSEALLEAALDVHGKTIYTARKKAA